MRFHPTRLVLKTCLFVCLAWFATTAAEAATGGSTLFRLFLTDGTALVSFGEFARLGERVIFSMPVGGAPDDPRIYVVTLPASRVDWAKTDEYARSTRARWYAESRGEQEFQALSAEVARVLNEVALAVDRRRALSIAENARGLLAEWPRTHFGYRQSEVREIVQIIDEAISELRASLGESTFSLSLVADEAAEPALAPMLPAPTATEQVEQVFHLASLVDRAADRVGLLQAALLMVTELGPGVPAPDARRWREQAERQLRGEAAASTAYAELSKRLMLTANKAAESANLGPIERALGELMAADQRLGRRQPETVESLRASLQAKLDAARDLRLRRDQWVVRRGLYADYQRTVGRQLRQLAKAQASLEAIRRLEGPSPSALRSLRKGLDGGADRLQRIGLGVPQDLHAAHDLLVSAWRFAEKAVSARSDAVSSGSIPVAWEASSAAAGALMMFSRAQRDISALIESPKLQ